MVSTLTIDKMINVTLVYTRTYATNVDPGEAVGERILNNDLIKILQCRPQCIAIILNTSK